MAVKSIRFFHQFIQHPRQTGAVFSSGSKLCQVLVQEAKIDHAKVILEFGTGNGEVTEKICLHKAHNSNVLGLEINKTFAEATIKRCPEAEILNCCATKAKAILQQRKLNYSDSIVSSLPWSLFSEHDQDNLLHAAIDVLRPGGIFVTYIYLHSLPLKSIQRFQNKLHKGFHQVKRSPIIWGNIPPAVAYISIK